MCNIIIIVVYIHGMVAKVHDGDFMVDGENRWLPKIFWSSIID
jgi:hypothetical protein